MEHKRIVAAILALFCNSAYSKDVVLMGIEYLNGLPNQKAACIAKIDSQFSNTESKQAGMLKRKEALSACYKKMAIDIAQKFYPEGHFGKDVEQSLTQLVNQQHQFYDKITHCPLSKPDGCDFYEDYDAYSAMVDYLNEMVEFMVLNVGEGYPDFNPENWLRNWDNATK